jgi:four helix bundle protein
MNPQQLRERTRRFAIDVIRFHRTLPRSEESGVIGRQLLRAGTGVGAHYRAACRARSDAEFVAKLGTAIEETDETGFWPRRSRNRPWRPHQTAIPRIRRANADLRRIPGNDSASNEGSSGGTTQEHKSQIANRKSQMIQIHSGGG